MFLREAILKHLLHFKENMEDVEYISISLMGTDDYVEILTSLVVVDNYFIPGLDQNRKPFCLKVTIYQKSPYAKNVSKEMEREFIEAEQREYSDYFLSFLDIEEGADKCVEMLSSVFGITKLEQVNIKTQGFYRIYSTEKLPPPKPQHRLDTEKQGNTQLPARKKIDWGVIVFCAIMVCPLVAICGIFIQEVIYYPIKTHMGSYVLKEDSTIDISNFTEWKKTSKEPDTLTSMTAVYMWCLEKNSTLPHKIMRSDPPFRTVVYNGDTLRVLFVGSANNIWRRMLEEFISSEHYNELHYSIATLLGIPKVKEGYQRLTLPEESNQHVINYMYYNLRLFYWKYYSGLWRDKSNEHEEVKELIELLHPPLNLYEAYSFDELRDFWELMVATNEQTDLKKAVKEYYEKKRRGQSRYQH